MYHTSTWGKPSCKVLEERSLEISVDHQIHISYGHVFLEKEADILLTSQQKKRGRDAKLQKK